MTTKTMCSFKNSAAEVVADVKANLAGGDARLAVYFASSHFDQAALATGFKALFPAATVIGCSTAGEIACGQVSKGSVAVMLLGPDEIEDLAVEVLEGVREKIDVAAAFKSFEKHFGVAMASMDHERHVGLVLADGLAGAEERLMDQIGDRTNVFFVGGSAGDDLAFKQTFISVDGRVYSNAAVLAVLKPARKFAILKTQSFKVLATSLTATKVDEAARTVIEFNGKPAVEAYAAALGVPVAAAADYFMTNPLGLMVGDEPYVRSPQRLDGQSMVFYCNIAEGMDLSLLESGDIVADTARDIAAAASDLGGIAGLINFNCILRTLELEKKGQTAAYGKVFADLPAVGFSTYGEEYLGHINQTATMLILGQN